MISLVIIVSIGLLLTAFVLFFVRLRQRRIHRLDLLMSELVPVNLDAFANLVDPGETLYLRQRLPSHDFKRVQRLRIAAALEYGRCIWRNSSIFLAASELATGVGAEQSLTREVSSLALELRMQALLLMTKLYWARIFPRSKIATPSLIPTYQRLSQQLVTEANHA